MGLCSEVKVSMSQFNSPSTVFSFAPFTMAPNAFAAWLLTTGVGSNKVFFNPGMISSKYGSKSFNDFLIDR